MPKRLFRVLNVRRENARSKREATTLFPLGFNKGSRTM
jgi:hypothetical protein